MELSVKRIKKCRYECSHCLPKPAQWESWQDYARHLAEAHNIGENVVHYCPYDGCVKHYTRKGKLTEHIKNKHSHNPNVFACDQCDYKSNTKDDLKRHKATHGEKTLQCTLCLKMFTDPSGLRGHMAHTHKIGKKPDYCPHERKHSACRECLGPEKAVQMARMCNNCAIEIAPNRMESRGHNGMCNRCEQKLRSDAADNGSTAPIEKLRRVEVVVFDQLLPLITYADGTPFPSDQRDERAGGGLGTSKVVKGKSRECDTSTNRFPDCLHIVRDENSGHALLVVSTEVDENSHEDRNPECESAKIDDTNWAVQQLLLKEFAPPGKPFRDGAVMVPFVMIKVNPNAYDGPRTVLADRVQAVADLINMYVRMPAAERAALPTHGPIVHVMYYHSKKGAKNLAHLAKVAPGSGWQYTVH